MLLGYFVVYADITYPAVVLHFRFFAKITQKLARTADGVVLGIIDDTLDVGGKLLLAYLPYLLRDDNSETIFPRTRVADIRCLAAGNEVDDVAGTQIFQNHVYLLTV